MDKHVGTPGERLVLHLTVKTVTERETDYGVVRDHQMATPEGDLVFWTASSDAGWLAEGSTYTVKATIKGHNTDDQGRKTTVVTRVMPHHEPERIPRVSIGLRRRR